MDDGSSNNKPSVKRKRYILLGFCLGFTACFLLYSLFGKGTVVLNEVKEVHSQRGTLTNPLIGCEFSQNKTILGLRELEEEIARYIDLQSQRGNASHISVYFRDLNNGPWFGLNEDEYFTPASLLKVPLMIAYFKKAEDNPEVLSKTFTYTPREDEIEQNYKPSMTLEEGKEYTVEDLITRMIAYSDNRAMGLLVDNIEGEVLDDVYQILGISFEDSLDLTGNIISVKEYASFFRVLFNNTLL